MKKQPVVLYGAPEVLKLNQINLDQSYYLVYKIEMYTNKIRTVCTRQLCQAL